jgi:hypothetical protein
VLGDLVDLPFKSCVWPVQGLCCSGPPQTSNVIILDTPRCELNECSSSSYGLSLFSSKACSHPGKGAGAMLDGSPSMSVGELWPEIDQLDEVGLGNASLALA